MGTRGAFGFRVDGTDKIGYNQFDSYPSGKGQSVVDYLRKAVESPVALTELVGRAKALRVMNEEIPPTTDEIQALQRWADTDVSTGKLTDWYCLLHKTHGDLGATLEAGYVTDNADFLKDSLFCEWAYIVNLDTMELEVYEGFQKKKPKGRYASLVKKPRGWKPEYEGQSFYYAVSLLTSFPLSNLPANLPEAVKPFLPPEEEKEEEEG